MDLEVTVAVLENRLNFLDRDLTALRGRVDLLVTDMMVDESTVETMTAAVVTAVSAKIEELHKPKRMMKFISDRDAIIAFGAAQITVAFVLWILRLMGKI